MSIKPLSPNEALAGKITAIPPFVIAAVNQLLTERFSGRSCTIRQNEVVELAQKIASETAPTFEAIDKHVFFDRHWLDFEVIYQKEGWSVIYDKPAYNETYEAFWTFSRKVGRGKHEQG